MQIITANELLSGASIYLDENDNWQSDMQRAKIFSDEENKLLDSILQKAKNNARLLSVEIEKVKIEQGRIIPLRLRERIRATGPSAPYAQNVQILQEGDYVSL